ncbi:MAG TPA: YicC/YloC family endoribonuclease [Hyphomonadaceae bacterium]|nr:YicC/YloC family endoribonuclease [Hyphomonadaceae bacterium]
MIRGMTGFGRAQGQAAWGAWAWEVRSVNGKAVDLRTNMPPGFEPVDFEARKRVKDRFQRGSFQVQLRVDLAREAGVNAIDTRELARLARLSRNWANGRVRPASFDGLLNAPGVIRVAARTGSTVDEAMAKDLLAGLDQALDMLAGARGKEGEALSALFGKMLDETAALVKKAGAEAAGQPDLVRERLNSRLAEMRKDAAVDPDRIAQEVMMMASRADVREELDRLAAHLVTARGILKSGDAAGRKLDFLCQELNREANTLCSKSASLELTNTGLALKSLIDQFREQVQNVE